MMRFLLCALLLACNPDDTPRQQGLVEGTAWFLGPIAGAPVRLHLSDPDGGDRGVVAESTTAEDGSFFFGDLLEEGYYLVRVELAGLPWSHNGAEGAFALGDQLETATGLIEPFAREIDRRERLVSVTPLSTLTLRITESLRAVNRDAPLAEARLGALTWLGLDPTVTGIGPREGALDTRVQHTLLLDAFNALADDLSAAVGIQVGTSFNPPDLLRILVNDALGAVPAGTFDGQGLDGALVIDAARNYALSPETLQTELRNALDRLIADDAGPWGRLEGRDVADLRTRLACSGSNLFPICKSERTDNTPPQLVDYQPETNEALGGERAIILQWYDPESPVASVSLERLDAPGGNVVEVYSIQRVEEDAFTFLVDTRAIMGANTLYLQTRATNDAGLTSETYPLQYIVRNVGPGVLSGYVFKGVAENVEVTIEGLIDGRWTRLGRARTDRDGAYSLSLTEYRGPIRATARGLEETPGSFHYDEALGEFIRWGGAQTLTTILPFYEPTDPLPLVITPFGDLAVALAQAWSQASDEGEIEAYEEAARRLAAHLLLSAERSLYSAVPVDPLTPSLGMSDGVRLTIGLACLAEQARGLGCRIFDCSEEDLSGAVTALDLVAAYRADAVDGDIDGEDDARQITITVNGQTGTLVSDPLRNHFTAACARWLTDQRRNGLGISLPLYAGTLQEMSLNQDERLFAPEQTPEPFDSRGPTITLSARPVAGEVPVLGLYAKVQGSDGPRLVIGASAELRIEATDATGVAVGESGSAAIEVRLVGGAPPGALTYAPAPADLGLQTTRQITAVLAPRHLGDGFEGREVAVEVTATDVIGQSTTTVFLIEIDRLPPVIDLTPPPGFGVAGSAWHTRTEGDDPEFTARFTDHTPMTISVELLDEQLFQPPPGGEGVDSFEATFPLRIARREEGIYPLHISATDAFGRVTERILNVHVDRTAPQVVQLASDYADERFFTTNCALQDDPPACALVPGAPRISLGPEAPNPIPFNKIQTQLGAFDNNLPTLRYQVSDNDSGTPPGQLGLRFAADGRLLPWSIGNDFGERSLPISREVLGIDNPLLAIPPQGTLWPPEGQRTLVVRDLAGNQTEIEAPTVALNILPPPLFIADAAPGEAAGVAHLPDLDFESLHQAAVDGRTTLRLSAWSLYNPWLVPVSYHITRPADVEVVVTGLIKPELNNETVGVLGTDPSALPPAPAWDRTVIRPGCLLGPDGEPDDTLEADGQITLEAQGDTVTRVYAIQGACRPRQYVNLGPLNNRPTVTLRWALPWIVLDDASVDRTNRWFSVASLGVQPIQGSLQLPADLAELLAGRRFDRAMTPVLDSENFVLFWNEPPPECPRDGVIPTHCRRGWWYTKRVLDIESVRIERPALTLNFAALCNDGPSCEPRSRPEPTTFNSTTARLNR